jgi:hypothetical protein
MKIVDDEVVGDDSSGAGIHTDLLMIADWVQFVMESSLRDCRFFGLAAEFRSRARKPYTSLSIG